MEAQFYSSRQGALSIVPWA